MDDRGFNQERVPAHRHVWEYRIGFKEEEDTPGGYAGARRSYNQALVCRVCLTCTRLDRGVLRWPRQAFQRLMRGMKEAE